MGVKKINLFQLISNGSMTGTSTILGASAQNVQNFDNVGIQCVWTGTPTGTFSVLCSNDNTTFTALSGFVPALSNPAGSAGSLLINLNQVPFPWVNVEYVNASGTGVLNVSIFSKDVN